VTNSPITDEHSPEPWFQEAGSDQCPHGPEPDYDTQPEAWDDWQERHTGSPQDVRICLDAPLGDACDTCSEESGEFVPWAGCTVRPRTAAVEQSAAPAPQHRPVTVSVGVLECLERECDEYFTDDGDEIPGKETCSLIHDKEICEACSEPPAGDADEYPAVVAWTDCPYASAAVPSA